MEAGGRQCLEHIVEQLSVKTDHFPCANLNSRSSDPNSSNYN